MGAKLRRAGSCLGPRRWRRGRLEALGRGGEGTLRKRESPVKRGPTRRWMNLMRPRWSPTEHQAFRFRQQERGFWSLKRLAFRALEEFVFVEQVTDGGMWTEADYLLETHRFSFGLCPTCPIIEFFQLQLSHYILSEKKICMCLPLLMHIPW